MNKVEQFYGTGRRKTASARVFLRAAQQVQPSIHINRRPLEAYLPSETAHMVIRQPLKLLQLENKFDITITVQGGGVGGQRDAIRSGITHALLAYEKAMHPSVTPTSDTFRQQLRIARLMTRDARIVERKKVGRHKARKSTQYSKR